MLLNNGLKYVPVPDIVSKGQLLSALDRFKRSVRLRCMFSKSGPGSKFRLPESCFCAVACTTMQWNLTFHKSRMPCWAGLSLWYPTINHSTI